MRPPTRRSVGAFVLALLVGAMLTGATLTAHAMPASTAASAGTMTYNDPAADAQGGPDVTTVTITGDPPTSTMRVTVNAPGYLPATADGLERDVLVSLDTDRNGATGDPDDGTEYTLAAWNDPSGRWWSVMRWNGSTWEQVPSPTLAFTRTGDALTWSVGSTDLGGATGFRFYVLAGIWSVVEDKWTATDDAPDGTGWWDYSLSETSPGSPAPTPATKVTLGITDPTTAPKQALAGKRFTVTFRVQFQKEEPITSIDISTGEMKTGTIITWTAVPSGKMVGDTSVAGKAIAHSETLKNGQARLSLLIPKTAKGKLLKVRVKITATEKETGTTVTATKIVTFRVR